MVEGRKALNFFFKYCKDALGYDVISFTLIALLLLVQSVDWNHFTIRMIWKQTNNKSCENSCKNDIQYALQKHFVAKFLLFWAGEK